MADPALNQLVDAAVTVRSSVACSIGDLLAINSSGVWVAADASTPSLYAQGVCVSDGVQSDQIYEVDISKRAYISDADIPYTMNARQYLSATAAAHTETRPTTDGDLIQIVGRALSTSIVYFDIKTPWLENAYVPRDAYDGTGEAGLGVVDTGWAGAGIDGNEATYTAPFRVPHNCCSAILKAYLVFVSINASAADIDITVVGAYDGASNVQDTGTAIATGDFDQADTDDIILTMDISSVLDTGLWLPGRTFQVFCDLQAITAEAVFLGMWLEYELC